MNTRTILQYLGVAAGNVSMVACAAYHAQKNHVAFTKMERGLQQKLYNECPLQKMGTTGDAIAALEEAALLHDPRQKRLPPIVPFDQAYPQTTTDKCPASHVKK